MACPVLSSMYLESTRGVESERLTTSVGVRLRVLGLEDARIGLWNRQNRTCIARSRGGQTDVFWKFQISQVSCGASAGGVTIRLRCVASIWYQRFGCSLRLRLW